MSDAVDRLGVPIIMNKQLIEQIEHNFPSSPIPAPNQLLSYGGEEAEILRARFSGREWQQLSLEDLTVVPGSVLILSPAAFRYYLPAYMAAVLRNYARAGCMIDSLVSRIIDPSHENISVEALRNLKTDSAIGISQAELEKVKAMLLENELNATNTASAHKAYRDTMRSFNDSQLHAIGAFVGWLVTEHGADDINGDYRRAQTSLLLHED